MWISASLRRKAIFTALAAIGFVSLYEVTIRDSQNVIHETSLNREMAGLKPGSRLRFIATAYCKGTTTTSGVAAQRGVVAADPDLLPVGSVVDIDSADARYDGIYTVMDTGPKVQGSRVDLYMWSCYEALDFGRQAVRLAVLRLGWNPRHTVPTIPSRLVDRVAPFPAPVGTIGERSTR
jgi:3D (Asp-Asp-Asp) domain-containing protein